MRGLIRSIVLSFFVLFFLDGFSAELYEEGQLFARVKAEFASSFSSAEILKSDKLVRYQIRTVSKAFIIDEDPLNRIYLIEFSTTERTDELIDELVRLGIFEYVEKVVKYKSYYTPNDLQSAQWNLKKIMAENAWDVKKGSSNIVIAIVDDAMDTAHPDLEPVVWRNKNEIRGNGLDDDGNGYVDDYIGWDAADGDNDPTPGGKVLQHGTHCSGIAGAATNNSKGIASVANGCRLMIAKIGRPVYNPYTGKYEAGLFYPYKGVEYAIINGARVISMSWGGGGYSPSYQALFDYAYKKGIVCVAAAGNDAANINIYPAQYDHVISVGSTTSGDEASVFSNYGSWVDVMAPGSGIYSTLPGNQYGYLSGTSMACPLVSGLCGLMFSLNPNATPDQIEACLKSGCDNIDAYQTKSNLKKYIGNMGAGRINAENSIKCLKSINADFTADLTITCPGDTIQFFDKTLPKPVALKWKFTGGTPASSFASNPKVKYASAGVYDVELIVFDSTKSDTMLRKNYITIAVPTATISVNRTIAKGSSTTVRIDFSGAAPYKVTVFDGSTSKVISNIGYSPYYYTVSPTVTTTYTIVAYSDKNCSGTFSGSSKVTVSTSGYNCANALRYQASFGGTSDDFAYGLTEDADGNIYISGNTMNYGNGDGFFAKFNSNGNMVWYKTYGGNSNDLFQKHIRTPDGGFLLVGSTYSYGVGGGDVWIVKVDTSGSVQWSKTIGGSGTELAWNAAINFDKGYLVYGNTNSIGAGDQDNYIIRLDKNGNVKWMKSYGNSYYSLITGLATYNDGSTIFCANYRTSTDGDPLIAKIDSLGNILWSKRFGGTNNDGIQGLTKDKNGNVYLAGYYRPSSSNQEMLVACFTPSGTNKWIKTYNGSGNEAIYNIEMDGDELILNGHTDSYGAGLSDASILKIDTSGNVIFAKALGGSNDEIFFSCLKSLDQGYYSVGHTKSFSNGGNDIFINKFSCKPLIGCNEKDYIPAVTNLSLSIVNENQATSAGGSLNTQSISATTRSISVAYKCKTLPSLGSNACLKVASLSKISATTTGFTGNLDDGDYFGQTVRNFGDFDGDGIEDLIVGCQNDDDGGSNVGAVYIIYLKGDGSVKSKQKISSTTGGFGGSITGDNYFGSGVSKLKDLNGDGINDMVVGHIYNNTVNARSGAVWILFLNSNGTVKSYQIIANGVGGFPSILDADDNFGCDVKELGDMNGDGNTDILVGAPFDDDGGTDRGAVYIIYLNSNGTVKSYKKISSGTGGFTGSIGNGDAFGYSVSGATDMNYDGSKDIVIGARGTDDGGTDVGAIWELFLNSAQTVIGYQKVSATAGSFTGTLDNSDYFGSGVESIGDIDNDGFNDIAVSAPYDDDGGADRGAVWLLSMDNSGIVKSQVKISSTSQLVLKNKLDDGDLMGWRVSALNDIDGDGYKEIITGAMRDDDGGTDRGAVYIFNLKDTCPFVKPKCRLRADFSYKLGCVGDTILFTDVSIDSANAGIIKWKWSFGDGKTFEGNPQARHIYSAAGTYLAKLVIYTDGNVSCTDSTIRQVKMSNQFRVIGRSDDTICMADSTELGIGATLCGVKPFTYLWQPATGLSNNKVLNPMASPGGTTRYILSITDKNNVKVYDTLVVRVDSNCCRSYAHFNISKTAACVKDTFIISNISIVKAGATYNWKVIPAGNYSSFSGKNPPALVFGNSGSYKVMLILNDLCGTDTMIRDINVFPSPSVDAGRDTFLCIGDSMITGPESIGRNTYTWNPATGLSDKDIARPTVYFSRNITYTLRMKTEQGCIAIDTINIGKVIEPVLNIGPDTSFCADTSFRLRSNLSSNYYLWSDGSSKPFLKIVNSGTYWLEVKNTCIQRDTANVSIFNVPPFSLGNDTTLCQTTAYQLKPNINASLFTKLWDNGSTAGNRTVTANGTYWLKMSDGKCSVTDSIKIRFSKLPFAYLGRDTVICSTSSITVNATDTNATSYLWNDGDTSPIRQLSLPGRYMVTLGNICGTYKASINIGTEKPPLPYLGDKVLICYGDTAVLDGTHPDAKYYLWNTGSVKPIIYVSVAGKYNIKMGNICGEFDTSVIVENKKCDCELFVPNTFTPVNTSGLNDLFKPVVPLGCEPTYYQLTIYNRWGELLYSTNDYTEGWNGEYKGKRLSFGDYVWIMTIQHPYMNKGKVFNKTGNVLIID